MPKKPRFEISGVEETEKLLGVITPKLATNLNRAVNLGIASEIGKKVRELAPVDQGDIKASVKWRRRRTPPEKPVSVVYAAKIKGGKRVFWWRFQEYGRGGKNPQSGKGFVKRSAEMVRENLDKIYREQFGKKLESLIKREKKKLAKK